MESQARRFLEFASKHYSEFSNRWRKYLTDKDMEFDEDVFSETIIKVYDNIKSKGIKDDSDTGLANYWFKSFQMNTRRERVYSRNSKRDLNVDASEELDTYDNGDEELNQKIMKELFNDYSIVYMLSLIEQNFDSLTFYCFRLYFILPKMTYDKLKTITNVKDVKKRVVSCKNWLKENVKKEDIVMNFNKWYNQ